MNLKPLAANQTELSLDKIVVFFSYQTPVAFYEKSTGKYFQTAKFWSKTTSRHVSKWLQSSEAERVPQCQLDALIDAVEVK